jgi:hypothetical protein
VLGVHNRNIMIWETGYWKSDLLRRASRLDARQVQRRWSGLSAGKLEQEIMLGFYSIRKLVEAHQVPDDLVAAGMRLRRCPAVGRPVTYLNYHRFSDLYDLSQAALVSHNLRFVCNQVVHSYVFAPQFNADGQVEAVLFNSDRNRNREIFIVGIRDVAGVFRAVGDSDPASAHAVFDRKRGDFVVSVGKSMEQP